MIMHTSAANIGFVHDITDRMAALVAVFPQLHNADLNKVGHKLTGKLLLVYSLFQPYQLGL